MADVDTEAILQKVVQHYLTSGDFNGTPVRELINISTPDAVMVIADWIKSGELKLCLGELHTNPYINRFGFRPLEDVLAALSTADLTHAVLYPSVEALSQVVDRNEYSDRPYALELALGSPQLSLRYFGLEVLDWYQRDPRYHYQFDDIRGWISMMTDPAESPDTLDRDKVYLKTFGVAYDGGHRPVVCTFIRYLSNLDPQHQRLWQSRELQGEFRVHPDYIRNSIEDEWGKYVSLYEALLMEMRLINQQCEAIGWKRLFRSDPVEKRPRGFGLLLRPTKQQYLNFCHTLDKLLSENLNRNFFNGHVPLDEEIPRKDGRIEVRQRGTIALLESWFNRYFRTSDPKPLADAISALKRVRKERQPQAHAIIDDHFDYAYVERQRSLISETYDAVRTIRLALACHPAAKSVSVPEVLNTGEYIWPL